MENEKIVNAAEEAVTTADSAEETPTEKKTAKAPFILSIISMALFWWFGIPSLVMSIISFKMIKSRRRAGVQSESDEKKLNLAKIFATIALIASIVVTVIFLTALIIAIASALLGALSAIFSWILSMIVAIISAIFAFLAPLIGTVISAIIAEIVNAIVDAIVGALVGTAMILAIL